MFTLIIAKRAMISRRYAYLCLRYAARLRLRAYALRYSDAA